MSACVFPGSFDPVTRGHVNLIERAAGMFDSVTVTVMVNIAKSGVIPYEERVKLLRKACSHLPNVQVELWQGLLADYMRGHPGSVVVRSVRNTAEFEQEMTAASVNGRLCPGLETVLIPAAAQWADVSSSAVREIAAFGGDISGLVPENICRDILERLKAADARKE